ncbi:MAG TPA: PAS domain-containing protein [Pyrinomonadaceae bacterium]|nr:PAS domain-containing protein [Pyrinomonadaceae bacterium]
MTLEAKIPAESKIIVGVSISKKTGWYSLHLHDALYAVSIRPDEGRVVVAEGRGPGRLQHMRFPFKNVLRFESVEVPIGHNCLGAPVDADQLRETHLIPEDKPFSPVMVRLLIKHSTRNDLISIHDLGATPLPLLVPLLRNLPRDRFVDANVKLSSADDCLTLARNVIEWVRQVNAEMALAREIDEAEKPVDQFVPQEQAGGAQDSGAWHYEQLLRICGNLDSYSKVEKQETLVGALADIKVSTLLHPIKRKNSKMIKMAGAARFQHNFPLSLASEIDDPASSVTVDHLFEESKLYCEKTRRPINEAFDAIARRVRELEQRRATIDSSEEGGLLEENAPQPADIIDPTEWINEKHRILSGLELRHEAHLRRVFENEGIDVCYIEKSPFLSLLVEYQTEDGEKHHAVVIRAGLHQALNEFLLAHEMGHWFLHVNAKSAARYEQIDRWLRSPAQRRFLEEEADNFAMAVLFPPAYLADHVIIQGGLSVDNLYDEFVAGMKPVGERLRAQMRHYMRDHIEKHEKFKKTKEPSFLTIEVESVEEKDIEGLLALIQKGRDMVYWVQLSKDSTIVEASDNSEELFGRSKKEIIGLSPIDLVVVPEEIERIKLRSEYRMKNKKAVYYFTEVKNRKENRSRKVIVYSFPILNNDKYVGAIAALRPLDEIERESSSSSAAREELYGQNIGQWNNVHVIDFSDVTSPS